MDGSFTRETGRGRVAYVLGAASWSHWMSPFLRRADIQPLVVGPCNPGQTGETRIARRCAQVLELAPDAVVVLAHQDSLIEDTQVGRRLQDFFGDRVLVDSFGAVRAGTDKLHMKRLFGELAVPTPEFAALDPDFAPAAWTHFPAFVKVAREHEGRGNHLVRSHDDLARRRPPPIGRSAQGYVEAAVWGDEYSRICVGAAGRYISLSPVSKGRTAPGAAHPAARVRLCTPADVPRLQPLADHGVRVIEALDGAGLAEIEAIDAADGPKVLEMNFRLAGTLRMSMLASGVNVIGWLGELALGERRLPTPTAPPCYVCELPFPAALEPRRAEINRLPYVTSTTRVTITARSAEQLIARTRTVAAILELDAAESCLKALLQAR